jgi:hypothetical protein
MCMCMCMCGFIPYMHVREHLLVSLALNITCVATGKVTPDAGSFVVGDTVKLAIVDQDRDSLDATRSVYDEITGGSDFLELGGQHAPNYTF